MKKLKKFENWIDDESADTNRRMAELDDNDENFNDYYDSDSDPNEIEFINKLRELVKTYETKISNDSMSQILHVFADGSPTK